ncbi:MAG: peroxiredoxin [Flavobacteriales bacterium]|nr:peroxiredoxin [Flavobacteriales bacterium]
MNVGDKAPNFSLKDQNGNLISSEGLRGKRIAIFFYPKDNTLVCTKEACSFRDHYEDFKNYNTEVIGISQDSDESHSGFAHKHGLQYSLLEDKGGTLAKAFGIKKVLGLISGRESFLVDENGIIIEKETSRLNADRHVEKLLKKLKSID